MTYPNFFKFCKLCNKLFISNRSLREHLENHIEDGKYETHLAEIELNKL